MKRIPFYKKNKTFFRVVLYRRYMKSRNTQKQTFKRRRTRKGSVRTTKKQRGGDLGNELLEASKDGTVVKVRELIQAGADLNKTNKDGHTPLIVASKLGHVDVVRELIKAGADLNKAGNKYGHTPLLFASVELSEDHMDIVRELIKAGALNANPRHAGDVLNNAIESQDTDMIKFVVKTLNEDDKLRKAVPGKDAIQDELISFAEETNDDELLDYLISAGIFNKSMRKLREKDRQKKRMEAAIPEEMPKNVAQEIAKFMGGRRKPQRKTRRAR